MGDPLPHRHLLTKDLVAIVSYGRQGDQKHWMGNLFYFLHVFLLVHTEGFDRYSFVVANAFPNIAKIAGGDGMLSRSDDLLGNDVGDW